MVGFMGHRFCYRLRGEVDPFTLLKVSRTFREMHPGDTLEFLCSGDHFPGELLKVLPAGCYQVEKEEIFGRPVQCRLVVSKINGQGGGDLPGGDSCCCRGS